MPLDTTEDWDTLVSNITTIRCKKSIIVYTISSIKVSPQLICVPNPVIRLITNHITEYWLQRCRDFFAGSWFDPLLHIQYMDSPRKQPTHLNNTHTMQNWTGHLLIYRMIPYA